MDITRYHEFKKQNADFSDEFLLVESIATQQLRQTGHIVQMQNMQREIKMHFG